MMKKALLLTTLCLLAVSSAMAVPGLQIYIDAPDATYDMDSQTWVTASSNFDVWVVASHLNKQKNGTLYDIGLAIALGADVDAGSGSIDITPEGGSTTNYTGLGGATGFQWGTPPTSDPLPGHGIYPANYVVVPVADQTPTDESEWIAVQDYIPGSDGGTDIHGFIYKFNVSTSYASVHFDAFGFYDDEFGKRTFAPFSHDGEMNVVPEPTTMVLLGFGLFGAGIARRKKN